MKNNQFGRSMIEMLGVLAIIGVLSVGGIAGYSKAMMKFRVNKTVDQVAQITTNMRTFFSSQSDYSGLGSNAVYLIRKAKIAPTEMHDTSSSGIRNPFGGWVWGSYSGKTSSSDSRAFTITFSEVPEEACLELAVLDWGAGSGSGLVAFGVNSDVGSIYVNNTGSTNVATPYSTNYPIPMKPSSAIVACQAGTNNTLYWKFY